VKLTTGTSDDVACMLAGNAEAGVRKTVTVARAMTAMPRRLGNAMSVLRVGTDPATDGVQDIQASVTLVRHLGHVYHPDVTASTRSVVVPARPTGSYAQGVTPWA
jgi:hypothetical protein